MSNFFLSNIHSDFDGYQNLINLYSMYKDNTWGIINVSLDVWLDANLCSALGGIMDLHKENMHDIRFHNIAPNIESILQKNEFLTYFSYPRIRDTYNTTIRYLKLSPRNGRYFFSYIKNELLERSELPDLSKILKENIAELIYEIFVNAQMHSETKHIYTCGQFFPKKKFIIFSVVDTGIGFRKKINDTFNKNLDSIQAVKWAFTDSHSTKKNISGGLGLALLEEFIRINKGEIEVVSDSAYYKISASGNQEKKFDGSFPGSMITMKFNTDDDSIYCLKNELNDNDVF